MTPKKDRLDIHGILLLDKPAGRSSNQAMQDARRLFSARKAGHTGNLDPFATGMLPVCFGEATKTAGFMLDADKSYRATAHLGAATTTGDTEGEFCEETAVPDLDSSAIEAAMGRLTGEIDQVPPMYSALKHQGQPLYKLARQGVEVERKARKVTINSFVLEDWNSPRLTFRVECSKGTYVRTLAEDLARELGTAAHLVALRRLHVTPFDYSQMVTLQQIEAAIEAGSHNELLLAVDAGLEHIPVAEITEGQTARFSHGNPVIVDHLDPGMVRVYGPEKSLMGLGEARDDGQVHPRRLFNLQPRPDSGK